MHRELNRILLCSLSNYFKALNQEEVMFEQEMNDLKNIYEKEVEDAKYDLDSSLPYLVSQMEEFCQNYRRKREIETKLYNMQTKFEFEKLKNEAKNHDDTSR